MKAFIPTSISLIGGLASHFCLFATPSMTPTVSSEPLSTESPSRICQQRSSIQVRSPRTFPIHGTDKPVPVDFDTFWHTPMRERVLNRMRGRGHSAEMLRAFLMSRDDDWAFELFHSRRTYKCLSQYFDGGIFDDAA